MEYANPYANAGGNMHVPSPVPLPPGWQVAVTATGETYYIDYTTKTTHWTIPEEVLAGMRRAMAPTDFAPTMGGTGVGYRGAPAVGGRGHGGARGNGMYGGAPRRGIDRTKLKTKMCMNLENGGSCSYGANCAFAHSSEELSSHPYNGVAPAPGGR